MTMTELENAIEALVDASSLEAVVNALANVAGAKAEHIASAWQDASTAKPWDGAARYLSRVAAQCERWSI